MDEYSYESSVFYTERSRISKVQIEDGVTSIGGNAFVYCILTSITIPSSVTSIGNSAFYDCTSLTSITIPSSVTSIGNYAFSGCSSLTSITIPSSVASIGDGAFFRCSSLTSITILSSVTSIGNYAFSYCSSLTSITIPSSVTSIGERAFHDCSSLTSITIPSSVTSIGDDAFMGCDSLNSITVDQNNTEYDSRNNCNAIIETSTNTLMQGCKNTAIPSSVTSIGDDAFFHCSSLTSITIPSSVTSIGSGAFSFCSSLSSVYIPSSVAYINGEIFINCGSYKELVVYTDASSKLEGWYEGWNYLNYEGKKAAVIYSTSLDQYKQIAGKKYTVLFNANGGTGKMSVSTINQYSELPVNAFTRKGYEFTGWNTNAKGTGAALNDKQIVGLVSSQLRVTLYAQWSPVNYSLIVNPNGGSLASKQSYDTRLTLNEGKYTDTYTINDATYKLPTLVKDGYKFDGWYDLSNSKKYTSIAKGSTGDVSLTAVFEPVTYKITYTVNSGKLVTNKNDNNYATVYTVETTALDLPDSYDTTRTGYTFAGWYADKAFTIPVTSLEELKAYNLEKNSNEYKATTLYAKWTPITYYIKYSGTDKNGNTVVSDPIPVKYDETYKLSDTVLRNPGMKATKYTYTVNGKSTTVSSTASIKNLVNVNTEEPIVLSVAKDSKKNTELWSAATYTITYKLNGGANAKTNKSSYTITTPSFSLNNPTKKGYDFVYWTDEEGNIVSSITPSDTSYGNRTFTANWSVISYRINFNADGGILPDDYQEGYIEYTVEDGFNLESAVKDYNTFAGWYSGKNKVTSVKKGTIGDMNIIAKWTEGVNYTVNYSANNPDGTVSAGKTSSTKATAGKTLTLASNGYKVNGKVFVEWNTSPDGSGASHKAKEVIAKNVPLSTRGEPVTLYAIWDDVKQFTIHYEDNCPETLTVPKDQTMYNNAYKALTSATLKRTGYTFDGWISDTGIFYKNKETFSGYKGDDKGTVTLYAKWTPVTYKITYSGIKSTDRNSNPLTYTVEDETVNLSSVNRTGYIFNGFYSDSKCKKPITEIDTKQAKNITVYAKFTPIRYNIEYDANTGNGEMLITSATYDKSVTLRKNTLTKKGYTFTGWNTEPNGSGITYKNSASVKNLTATDESTVILYAQWKLNTYKITYSGIKSTDTNSNPLTYTVEDETITLNDPQRSGYAFGGWYSDSKYKNRVTVIDTSNPKSVTLYAKLVKSDFKELMNPDAYQYCRGNSFEETKAKLKATTLGNFKLVTYKKVESIEAAGNIISITVNGVKNTYETGMYFPTALTEIVIEISG